MRKIFALLLVATSFCFISCSKNTPNEVIKAYLTAASSKDSLTMEKFYPNGSSIIMDECNLFCDITPDSITFPSTGNDMGNDKTSCIVVTNYKGEKIEWMINRNKDKKLYIAYTRGLYKPNYKRFSEKYKIKKLTWNFAYDRDCVNAIKHISKVKEIVNNFCAAENKELYYPGIKNMSMYDLSFPDNMDGATLSIIYNSNTKNIHYNLSNKDYSLSIVKEPNSNDLKITDSFGLINTENLSIFIPEGCRDLQLATLMKFQKYGVAFTQLLISIGDVWIKGTNYSNKAIKYLTWTLVGKNSVGDTVTNDYYKSPVKVKGIGPIKPGESFSYNFDSVWGRDTHFVEKVICTSILIQYMDGTSKTTEFIME